MFLHFTILRAVGRLLFAAGSVSLSLNSIANAAALTAQIPRAPAETSRSVDPVARADKPLKPRSITDRVDLEAFFDGVVREHLEFKHIAGAVVAVVAGNQVVFAKGYGFADVDARRLVDPETTQFRIASISKLFVWTAVMQLVEEGKLDLDADINSYLKGVKVPATYPQPIRMKDLLTHTPGFEDNPIGLFSHSAAAVKPLEEVLRAEQPARVRPPGVLASYSNYGTALAALVVADVSGKSYEDVVQERIFAPLGMKHTLVRQPAPDKLPPTISKSYKWKEGRFKDEGFEYIRQAPAGTASASAADMTHFLLAHLHDGVYGKARILKSETARRMREPLFRHEPNVDAMCYGFWEIHRNGQRILEHGGDTDAFHSLFAMLPERGVGLFVSYNTDQGAFARDEILPLFLDRYYPPLQDVWPKPVAEHGDLKRFAGEYASTRHSDTTFAKVASLLGGNKIAANADGTLTFGAGPALRRYVPVEPLVFQELYGPRRIVFRADAGGHITHAFFSDLAAVALVRRGFFESSAFNWGLVEACAVIFATAVLFWPTIAFCTRHLASPFRKSRGSALISLLGWLSCAVCLGFVGGMMVALEESNELVFGVPRHLQYLMLVPQVCAVLAALVLPASIIAWRKAYWRFSGRLHYTLVALAGVAFVWFLHYSNLLTFGLRALSRMP